MTPQERAEMARRHLLPHLANIEDLARHPSEIGTMSAEVAAEMRAFLARMDAAARDA